MDSFDVARKSNQEKQEMTIKFAYLTLQFLSFANIIIDQIINPWTFDMFHIRQSQLTKEILQC